MNNQGIFRQRLATPQPTPVFKPRPVAPPLRPVVPPLRPIVPPLRPVVPPIRPVYRVFTQRWVAWGETTWVQRIQ